MGSSANLSGRFKNYYNKAFCLKYNMLINKALLKYGYSNFQLEILEYTSPEKAIEIEQYYLDLLNESSESLNYNILKKAGSRLGYKVLEETKEKLRIANLGVKNPNFGKSHSKETREKISKTLLKSEYHPSRFKPGNYAFKGKSHSTETKDKMRIAKLGANNPNFGKSLSEEAKLNLSSIRGSAVEVYDIETQEKSFYSSLTKAAAALGCSKTTISKYIESKELFRGKYRITKASNNDGPGVGKESDRNYQLDIERSDVEGVNKTTLSTGVGDEVDTGLKFHLQRIHLDIFKYIRAVLSILKARLLEIYF